MFSRLLNQAIEKVGAKSTDNIQADFKACGIVPFVTFLSILRTGEQAPKRDKKVNVPAGKSICVADIYQLLLNQKQMVLK